MERDELQGRICAARFQLLILISMLDYTPLHDVGFHVMELGEAMASGASLPALPDVDADGPGDAAPGQ